MFCQSLDLQVDSIRPEISPRSAQYKAQKYTGKVSLTSITS
jgi:hypothetical protein